MYLYARKKIDITYSKIFFGFIYFISNLLFPYFLKKTSKKIYAKLSSQGHAVAGLSCRTLFDAYLRSLTLTNKSEIIFSEINIPHMREIALHHKLKITTVPIDRYTLKIDIKDLKNRINKNTKIVLVAHLFGALTNINEVADYLKSTHPHIKLIEDYAEAFYDLESYKKCAYADMSLISFGKIKTKTSLGGGLAVFKSNRDYNKVKDIIGSYPTVSPYKFPKNLITILAYKFISTPLCYFLFYKTVNLFTNFDNFIINSSRGFKPGNLIHQIRKSPDNAHLKLLYTQLTSTNNKSLIQRIRTGEEINQRLKFEMAGSYAERRTWWIAPIIIDNPKLFCSYLRKNHIDSTAISTQLKYIGQEKNHWYNNVVYIPAYNSLNRQLVKNITKSYISFVNHD